MEINIPQDPHMADKSNMQMQTEQLQCKQKT
jgi:hypothetical protein